MAKCVRLSLSNKAGVVLVPLRVFAGSLLVAALVLAIAGPASAASLGAVAWGENEAGSLGNGTYENSDVPVAVSALSAVRSVSAGLNFSLALLEDGTVMAWGAGGELGNGSSTGSDVPVTVSGLSQVTAVSTGWSHSLALLTDGTVRAWGYNLQGQLGDGSTATNSDVPVTVSGLSEVVTIASGQDHSLALLKNGTVMAWGANESGQLGDGMSTGPESCVNFGSCSRTPVPVSGLSEVVAIAAGGDHSLALLKNGTIMAWGDNAGGELGNGTTTSSDTPVAVSGLSEVTAIAAGGEHSLALLKDGTVRAWGYGAQGQLGNGTNTETSDVPVVVSGLSEVTAIAGGGSYSLALLKNGTMMAWGANSGGELGNGTTTNSDLPVAVDGLSEVTAIAGGDNHSLAVGLVAPLPTVSKLEPNTGPAAGGMSVTITGMNLSGATAVKFGATNATSFTVNSATSITAVSPAGVGTVDVTVTTGAGISATGPTDQFGYGPRVTKVDPIDGPQSGGTSVTITGDNFAEVTAVKFGATDATSFKVDSGTEITAISPAGTGTVDVTVTTAGGTSAINSADQFNYGPIIHKLEPDYGAPGGGTQVMITGVGFTGATMVKFGSTEAANFKVDSETEITAISPPGTGKVEVTVASPGGTSPATWGDQFDYGPTVLQVRPRSGAAAGGTSVTITGTNFTGATAVDFGSENATSFSVESDTTITAVSPAFSGGSAAVPVTVTTSGGVSSTTSNGTVLSEFYFTYAPLITSVQPSRGPAAGGTTVTITGIGFSSVKGPDELLPFVKAVKFGSSDAASFKVEAGSPHPEPTGTGGTQPPAPEGEEPYITAVSPPGIGTVNVTVETYGGTSAIVVADQFSYGGPLIENESVSDITETDATLEAKINPNGLNTTYAFHLQEAPSCLEANPPCNIAENQPITLPSQELQASSQGQSVSVNLNAAGVTLKADGEYKYWVTATNGQGPTESIPQRFTAAASPSIDSEWVSNVTETDATLNATIDPYGFYTAYQFQIDTNSSYNFPRPACPLELPGYGTCEALLTGEPLPAGLIEPKPASIAAHSPAESVSVDLASIGATLQPGTIYHYRVIAADTSNGVTVYGPDQMFTMLSTSGGGSTAGGSSQSSSTGNGSGSGATKSPMSRKPKSLTRAQKLKRALKACKKKPRRKRAACERRARKRYGPLPRNHRWNRAKHRHRHKH